MNRGSPCPHRRPRRAVLIVGAGPAGLATAVALADLGVASLLVERRPALAGLPRATVVSTRSMELVRGWGLERDVRAGGVDVDGRGWMCETLAGPPPGAARLVGYPSRDAAPSEPHRTRPACRRTTSSRCCSSTCVALGHTAIELGTEVVALDRRRPTASARRSATAPRARSARSTPATSSPPTARTAPSAAALGIAMHGPDRLAECGRSCSARRCGDARRRAPLRLYVVTAPGRRGPLAARRAARPLGVRRAAGSPAAATPSPTRSTPAARIRAGRRRRRHRARDRAHRRVPLRRAARRAIPRRRTCSSSATPRTA